MQPIGITIQTSGEGYWSIINKDVRITHAVVHKYDDGDWGELRVIFDVRDWDTKSCGLIYTDPLAKQQLQSYLTTLGVDSSGLVYSEQGMQSRNYISFDIDQAFIDSWEKVFGTLEIL